MELSDLKSFAQGLKEKFTIADAASPEDQLKFPVAHLLKAVGGQYDLRVKTKTEIYLYERRVRNKERALANYWKKWVLASLILLLPTCRDPVSLT